MMRNTALVLRRWRYSASLALVTANNVLVYRDYRIGVDARAFSCAGP